MVYWYIFKFHLSRFFVYPFEIIAEVLKRLVWLTFLIYFWSVIAKGLPDFDVKSIVSYFLISTGVRDIVMARWGVLGSDMGRLIKDGSISNYLLKPASVIPVIYARANGKRGFRTLFSIVLLIAGLVINGLSYFSLLMFIILLLISFVTSFAHNLIEGSLYFIITEASGIRNSIQHLMQVLSGSMAPLYLFPTHLRNIALLTPYPSMVYGPTRALTTTSMTGEIKNLLLVGFVWSIFLNIIAYWFWNWTKKRYEAVGI